MLSKGLVRIEIPGLPKSGLTDTDLKKLDKIMKFMTQNLWSRWIENDPTLTINDRKRIHLAGLKITGDTDHYRALIEDIGLDEE